jgi:endonuclease-3 related protein
MIQQTDVARIQLSRLHEKLVAHYDVDGWHWQASTPAIDICVGAILVQHTAWANVEKALANLRDAGAMTIERLRCLPVEELAALVRPAGTPLTKARRLKALARLVLDHGSFEAFFARPIEALRPLLLATPGIGPETADAILLYAADKPVVVHDAYTQRICRRIGIGPAGDRYADWRAWQDESLPRDLELRRRFHAAVVLHGKTTCRVRPRCASCPLAELCAFGRAALSTERVTNSYDSTIA